jgi:paraquat-inducible protein B
MTATGRCHGRIPARIQVATRRRRSRPEHFAKGNTVPALIDKITDIAKKLRKSAKKVNDAALQELITDLSLSVADLRVELAEQRQTNDPTGTTDTTATTATTRTTAARTRDLDIEAASTRASTLSLGTTTTQLPDIGELRKFPD